MNLCSVTTPRPLEESGFTASARPQSIDLMLQRFFAQCLQLNKTSRTNDIAVVFLKPGPLQNVARQRDKQEQFSSSTAQNTFFPFSEIAKTNRESVICYILRFDSAAKDFKIFYCSQGSPTSAIQHFRVEFQALLRCLLQQNYRYLMKEAHLAPSTQ